MDALRNKIGFKLARLKDTERQLLRCFMFKLWWVWCTDTFGSLWRVV